MAFPVFSCAIKFDGATWTDVSTYLRAFDPELNWKHGRQKETDQFTAGELSVVLDNRDRRFEPGYSGSPYYPNIKPNRQIRIQVTWNSITYDCFTGSIDDWIGTYDKDYAATTTVRASDGMATLNRTKMRVTYFDNQTPIQLGITTGVQSSYYNVITYPDPSVFSSGIYQPFIRQPGNRKIVIAQSGLLTGQSISMYLGGYDASGNPINETVNLLATAATATSVNTYQTLDLLWVYESSSPYFSNTCYISVYTASLMPQEFSNWSTQHALDVANWPTANRSIQNGQSLVQAYIADTDNVLTVLQRIAATEGGLFYVDESGNAVFENRYDRSAKSSIATFDPQGTLPYESVTYVSGNAFIRNEVTIQPAGLLQQTAYDAISQRDYFTISFSQATLQTTSGEALDQANWLLVHTKDPKPRITNLVLRGDFNDTALWPVIFGLKISKRITVVIRPKGGGAAITLDCFIESKAFAVRRADIVCTLGLSPASLYAGWILDDTNLSILDSTTIAGY